METEFIVIIVLLVLIVVTFLAVVIFFAVAAAKVTHVIQPIQTTIRSIQGLRKGEGKLRGKARQVAQRIRTAVTKDLRSLQRSLGAKMKKLRVKIANPPQNLRELFERGLQLFSGDPCSNLQNLWSRHIVLTYQYGMLALASTDPLSTIKQEELKFTAGQLLDIQQQLADLMSVCVSDAQKPRLAQLLKDHILIVADMAMEWRKDPSKGLRPALVQKWRKNAMDTVNLLDGQSYVGKQANDALRREYMMHLDMTAKYLIAIAAMQGHGDNIAPSDAAKTAFEMALAHAPMLANVFCDQMKTCEDTM